MEDYVDSEFHRRVEEALVAVGRVIDDESRKLRLAGSPSDEEEDRHTYNDKFGLAEFLTKMALSAVGNVLERMGLNGEKLESLIRAATVENRPVTLRFEARETCEFIGEHSFQVKSPQTFVATESTEESAANANPTTTTTSSTKNFESMTTVKEYRWKVGMSYRLSVFAGVGSEDRLVIGSRDGFCEVVTNTKNSPLPANLSRPPMDVPLTWFLRCVDPTSRRIVFGIDRDSEHCRTPSRNRDVREALEFFNAFGNLWALHVYSIFEQLDYRIHVWRSEQSNRGSSSSAAPSATAARIEAVKSASLFVPVLPLFEYSKKQSSEDANETASPSTQTAAIPSTPTAFSSPGSMPVNSPAAVIGGSSTPSPLLQNADINKLLTEQCRAIDLAASQIAASFPPPNSTTDIVTTAEAQLALLTNHATTICFHYRRGIDHIEKMLRDQLVAAVGKHLCEDDFEEFARFHYTRKLFRKEYVPRAFCHAIRRPGHYPDGILSIEAKSDAPIHTFTRSFGSEEDSRFMRVPINAATEVEIGGKCHLHAWMLHRFGGRHGGGESREHQLVARARQFSCFLLLLGKISGPDSFDPEDAIIVQNKDEVFIPLLLEDLPTPKEFRDAVASLSPEQRRFAEAYRQMQLESSVFGLCVVQLKPQLEVLLGLAPTSLTKEVKLTQDLLQLFMEYQIPSDLLSFNDGLDPSTSGTTAEIASALASPMDKLNAVKGHVKSVQEMIQGKKDEELSEAEQRADMRNEVAACSAGGNGFSFGPPPTSAPPAAGGGWPPSSESFRPLFGAASSSLFGAPTPSTPFGAAPVLSPFEAPASSSSHFFGAPAPSSPFGAPAPSNLFGAPAPSNLFGAPAPSSSSQLFGAPAPSSSSQLFGAPAPSSQLFGNTANGFQSMSEAPLPAQPVPLTQARTLAFELNPTKQETQGQAHSGMKNTSDGVGSGTVDFTFIPKQLDAKMATVDVDSALRTTIVKTGSTWIKKSPQNVLSPELQTSPLDDEKRRTERNRAFDLLDALSRSGSLPIRCAELHVIVAATHSFDESVVDTVIKDNVNPIEKVECSALLMATTIYGMSSPAPLLKTEQDVRRVAKHSSALFATSNLQDSMEAV